MLYVGHQAGQAEQCVHPPLSPANPAWMTLPHGSHHPHTQMSPVHKGKGHTHTTSCKSSITVLIIILLLMFSLIALPNQNKVDGWRVQKSSSIRYG